MSVTIQHAEERRDRPERTLDCGGCGTPVPESEAVEGSYCSAECYHRHRGAKALNLIEHDHRFCSSCYRPTKTVYRPDGVDTPELRKKAVVIRDAFVGFETLTDTATRGPYGLECDCGSVGSNTVEDLCRDGEAYEIHLKWTFATLRDEGQHEATFTLERFADTYYETGDFERAVGEALYA